MNISEQEKRLKSIKLVEEGKYPFWKLKLKKRISRFIEKRKFRKGISLDGIAYLISSLTEEVRLLRKTIEKNNTKL